MALYNPTLPPKSLQDVLAAAPPETSVSGVTRLLTADMKTVEVQGLPFALPQEVTFGTAKVYGNFVTGYAYGGLPNSDTQDAIDYALTQGYPAWSIQWRYLGEQGSAPVEVGTVSAAAVSLRPTVAAPSLVGVRVGSISAPAVTLRPSVVVGTLTGVQEGVGVIGAASVLLTPSVAAPSLAGVSAGNMTAAGVTLQPTVAAGIVWAGAEAPVTATLSPAGAAILYTLNGSNPLNHIVTDNGLALFDNGELITTGDPAAYIYSGPFQVRSGETLRYVDVASDGTISPEVIKTYAELAGIGSLSAPAVSLTPSVAAPSLSGVQIGAVAAASVSIQPTVSPATLSCVQVGAIAAAPVSLRPSVAVPSVSGVRVGSIGAAAVSLQPFIAVGSLTGVGVSAPTTAPTITATGGSGSVSIALTAAANNSPTSYTLRYATSAGGPYTEIPWADILAATNPDFPASPYVHNVAAGTYYYMIAGVNGGGTGPDSAVVGPVVSAAAAPSDDFNRADGTLGTNWSTVEGKPAPIIVSQAAMRGPSAETQAAYWSANSFADSQWAIARIYPAIYVAYDPDEAVAASIVWAGPSVRTTAGGLGYHASIVDFHFDDGETQSSGLLASIFKNGVKVAHAGFAGTYAKITVVNTVITVYGGDSAAGPWTEYVTYSDGVSPVTSGSAGIVFGGVGGPSLDDWSGGNV